MTDTEVVFTMGHSTHPIERFVALLVQHGIEVLADVRSTPFSRFNPQFNRSSLTSALAEAGIRYEFLGEELGARSNDPACYEQGRVSYARLAQTALFRKGIERLRALAREHRVAIMCAEREPLDCHRTILVARELERSGVAVMHILADGTLEPNRQTISRLVRRLGLADGDLFGESAETIEAAYDAQAAKIAYVLKPGASPARPKRSGRSP